MQTFQNKDGKPVPLEWFMRIAIMGALIFGGIKLFNLVAPTLIEAFKNFWILALVGIPAIALVTYIISNPMVIWMGYKTLCRKLTSFFIKMDPISFMERYVDLLLEKRKGLQKSKENLLAKYKMLEREIDTLKKDADDKMKLARAAKNLGDEDTAALKSSMAAENIQSIDLYKPLYNRMKQNIDFLEKLDSNWGRSIEKLQFTVSRKKKEWETMNTMAKALGMAEEFAKGDTEASRIYNQSLIALEEKVTTKIAFIEEFENNSKNIMKSLDLEKAVMDEDGMNLLDRYMKDGNLFLEEDYSDCEIKVQQGMFDAAGSIKSNFASSNGKTTSNTTSEFKNLFNSKQ